MKLATPFVTALSVLACLTMTAQGAVISENFNDADSFGSAYIVNSGGASGDDLGDHIAARFSVPLLPGGLSGSWNLLAAEIIMAIDSADDEPAILTLYSDDAGLPGTALASSSLSSMPVGFSNRDVVRFDFATTPALQTGESYWFGLSLPDPDFARAYWVENTTGVLNNAAQSFNDGDSWSAITDNDTPSLRVIAIPEPASAVLLGLAGLALIRRPATR